MSIKSKTTFFLHIDFDAISTSKSYFRKLFLKDTEMSLEIISPPRIQANLI